MKTGPELPGREPDLLFIARENLGRLEGVYLDGPADLVIEVVARGIPACCISQSSLAFSYCPVSHW